MPLFLTAPTSCSTHGDRRQEVVFIGTGLSGEKQAAITAALNWCLLCDGDHRSASVCFPLAGVCGRGPDLLAAATIRATDEMAEYDENQEVAPRLASLFPNAIPIKPTA